MCNQHQSKTMCHFVPGYILENIANSEAIPDKARQAAITTLSADQGFREQRMKVLASDGPPATLGDPNVPAAQTPIGAALVGPTAMAQPPDGTTNKASWQL
ncbi:unnamed protein product [Fusarium graminearum]|uniref:Uncharacterized protein n=1 Tax=Gibberella zeae TaxID=5518 RepID=A0A4E9ECE1_GIBZA|nr:unnamed protein product [Fusarium graminearum]